MTGVLRVLSWLGISKVEKKEGQFFGNIKKRAIAIVLLSSLLVLYGVKILFTYLIPNVYLNDSIISVMPGTLGVLVALVYILVLERILQDKIRKR